MLKRNYKNQKAAKLAHTFLALTIVFALSFSVWGVVRIVKAVQFSIDCASFVERAAVANTIDLAQAELGKAIDCAEERGLTSGIVSIFLQNPSNDIGFWYTNMTASYDELVNLPDTATQLERTNVLMKLRESLTDTSSSDGSNANIPEGISIYPHNVAFFWWSVISILGATLFLILWTVQYEKATGKPLFEVVSSPKTIKVNTVKVNKKPK